MKDPKGVTLRLLLCDLFGVFHQLSRSTRKLRHVLHHIEDITIS